MKKPLGVVIGIGVVFYFIGSLDKSGSTYSKPKDNQKEKTLNGLMIYLDDIQEVDWWEVDDNTIYISFNPVPDDWNAIIRGAALGGNKAIGSGVHVWALNNQRRGWRPSNKGDDYLGNTTARYGKIK